MFAIDLVSRRTVLAALAGLALAAPAEAAEEPRGGPLADGGWGATLTDHTGKPIGGEMLRGRPYALYFGYTHCPDVCPTSMYDMTLMLEQLGESARDFRVYFVSVDPERDTLDLLKVYMENFDPRIIGVRGSPEDIAKVARQFRAIYRKEGTGDSYAISHTASVFLIGRDGKTAGRLPHGGPIEPKIARLRALLATGS